MPKTWKSTASAAAWLALCAGCASAPSAPPSLPPPPAKAPLGPAFIERMESFLSGKLPEPIDYALPSKSAKLGSSK
jgi:hypothetical protein